MKKTLLETLFKIQYGEIYIVAAAVAGLGVFDLKSNMERFILINHSILIACHLNLKSNMERFIWSY